MKVPCYICNKPSVDARDMTITGLPDIRGWCEDEFHKKQVNDSCDRFYAMLHPVTDTTQHDPSKPIACAFCGAISMTVPIKPTHTQELQKQLRELDDEGYQPSTGAIGNKAADALASSDEELARLREQLEVERMRLVACGVVAMANTPESAAKNRQMKDEYRSGSLDDVIHIVDSEMALREQVLAQQARIAQMRDGLLHYSDIRPDTLGRTVVLSDEGAIARNALATTDDLSALAEHDKQVWNEALTTGIEWQATRGHTLDADDYGNELRSLKR